MSGEMSPLGHGDEGGLRASHDDRERVVELLRVAAGDGRLTGDELDDRLERALTARTHGELAVLTSDLPAVAGPAAPKDLVRIECKSSSTQREGRWLVPKRMQVRVTSGTVRLDFTQAVITHPTLEIDAEVKSGALMLVTKPGIVVDVDEVSVRSGAVKVRTPGDSDAPPTLLIQVSGTVGSGVIAARPPRRPRRTFWQWLLRRPRPPALPAGRV